MGNVFRTPCPSRSDGPYVTLRLVRATSEECDIIILQNKSDAPFSLRSYALRFGHRVVYDLSRDEQLPSVLMATETIYLFVGSGALAGAALWQQRGYLRAGPGAFVAGNDVALEFATSETLFLEHIRSEDIVAAYSFREDGATCSTSIVLGQIICESDVAECAICPLCQAFLRTEA